MAAVQIGSSLIFGLAAKPADDPGPFRIKVGAEEEEDLAVAVPAGFTGLMVATPCYGNSATIDYQQSILRLALACQARRIPCEIVIRQGESLVTRARNGLVATFLASSYSHLLLVDADGGFEPQDILRLLRADKEVIGGVFRMKTEDIRPAIQWLGRAYQPGNIDATSGAFEVQTVGAALMLIQRSVFATLAEHHPELRCLGPTYLSAAEQQRHYAFFDCAVIENRYWGEDLNFCRLWRALGGSVWVLPDMNLRHHGVKTYAMSLAELIKDNNREEPGAT